MAFDGITIHALKYELENNIIGGRIDKIYQPENDEIILNIRCFGKGHKLLLTANPSNPKFHFTNINKNNPANPPLFCMVLRKHLQSGKIIKFEQVNFDRILNIYIESLNEMGDYSVKKLVLEIMGRHSNIILVDENNIILDCAKHISHDKSSVREVLPGKEYSLPPSQDKINPLNLDVNNFYDTINNNSTKKIQNIIYQSYVGISPVIASEICYRAGINPASVPEEIDKSLIRVLYSKFYEMVESIKENKFQPVIIRDDKKLLDFSPFYMYQFSSFTEDNYDSMSEVIENYYATKDFSYRINQKTQDLKKIITQNIERCVRKKEIQIKTLKEIENREELSLYGNLLTANIYSLKKGMTSIKLQNFYSEDYEEIEIPLEGDLTPSENCQKYFKQYNKAKRTFEALQEQIKTNDEELNYLEGVLTSVGNCVTEDDIKEIRRELRAEGYLKKVKNSNSRKSVKKSKPLHFISSDGFDIYVGKNNIQNDELTLKMARSRDIWLHTKVIPGSHVIIVTNGNSVP
ncbi:MAG: NFACT family protein, partial [Lachnospirales bacterium]